MKNIITVEYNSSNSIFLDCESSKPETIVLNESLEFIHGFSVAEKLYEQRYVSFITVLASDIIDRSYTIHKYIVSESDLKTWSKDRRFEDISFMKALCVIYKVDITKRYTLTISFHKDDITFIQFKSLDFLNGFVTYTKWSIDIPHRIHNVFDNSRSYKLNVECQSYTIKKRRIVKKLLGILLLPDICDIIWNYVMNTCESKPDSAIKCVTEIDIISDSKDDKYQYTIFEDISNNMGILRTYTNERTRYPKCSYCKLDSGVRPLLFETTLV
jgi:hypothetical protein